MAPLTFAPASLGLTIVLVTTAIIAFLALSGFALCKLRTSIAASRLLDVEAANQNQVRDTFGRLTRARVGVDSNTPSQAMPMARPVSSFIQGPPKTTQYSDSCLTASSSFEAWASSLCDLIEDFTGVERDPKAASTHLGLVPSSSFEVWASNLCDLISELASPTPFRSQFRPLVDTKPVLSPSVLYTTDIQTNAFGMDNKQTGDHTSQHGQSQSIQYLSPTSAFSLPPVDKDPIVEYEPEETLKSVFESDSEDDETYYSRRPHLSRPKYASQSMSSMLRNIVEKRKAQQSQQKESKSNKENSKKYSRTTSKRRLFSKALPTPSEPRNPIKVPTIRFTPPTPRRRFTNENEDVGSDLGRNEVVERIAFDLVIDDHGRCFF